MFAIRNIHFNSKFPVVLRQIRLFASSEGDRDNKSSKTPKQKSVDKKDEGKKVEIADKHQTLDDLLSSMKVATPGNRKEPLNIATPNKKVKVTTKQEVKSKTEAVQILGDHELEKKSSVGNRKLNLATPNKKVKDVKVTTKQEVESKTEAVKILGDPELDKKLSIAVKEVAHELGGDTEKIENELISKLRESSADNSKIEDFKADLNSLFQGMKVDEEPKMEPKAEKFLSRASKFPQTYGDKFDNMNERRGTWSRMPTGARGPKMETVYGGTRLNIFSDKIIQDKGNSQTSTLETWTRLKQREIAGSMLRPPANAFEEQILWTKQGKLWKYPINNEQGLEEEAKIGFHEHIFLERHLKNGFPEKGPVRVFMELVCIGLSKNHHLSLQEKLSHIDWLRQYCKANKTILDQAGVL